MELRPIIRGLRDRGMTVFLNSHLLTEVEQVCDRVGIVARGQLVAVGTLEDLLVEPIVRLRVGELGADQRAALERFGQLADDGDWVVVRGLRSERVPELVSMLVDGGVQVYAVEPMRESLESRFRALVGSGDVT
jgi:ABC-2 type transport system ATP-binding protein